MINKDYFSVSLCMKFTLGKAERLKSRKLIEKLFEEGTSLKVYPFRLTYLQITHTSDFPVQAAFSASKKRFKKAVERNRIKRLLKEAYRYEKHIVYEKTAIPYVFMITFIGKEVPAFVDVKKSIRKLLNVFVEKIK